MISTRPEPGAAEDRRQLRSPRDDDRRQRAQVLRVDAARRPPDRPGEDRRQGEDGIVGRAVLVARDEMQHASRGLGAGAGVDERSASQPASSAASSSCTTSAAAVSSGLSKAHGRLLTLASTLPASLYRWGGARSLRAARPQPGPTPSRSYPCTNRCCRPRCTRCPRGGSNRYGASTGTPREPGNRREEGRIRPRGGAAGHAPQAQLELHSLVPPSRHGMNAPGVHS